MSVGPVSSALTGVAAGRLTDKVGAGHTVCFGAIALTIATAAMVGLPYFFGFGGFIVAFMLLAPSYQVFLAAMNTSVMENVPEHDRGVTSGVLNLSRNFGFILGASSVSAVFWLLARIKAGTGLDDHTISIAMAGTFAVCCILAFCVLLLTLLLNSARFQHYLRKEVAAYES